MSSNDSHGTVLRGATFGRFRVAEIAMPPGWTLESHRHETAQVCFVLEGEYEECNGTSRRRLRPGDVFYRPAAVPHSNRFSSEDVLTLLVSYRDNLGADAGDRAHPIPFALVHRLTAEIIEELRRDGDSSWELEGLGLLLGATVRRSMRGRSDEPPGWIREALSVIERGFASSMSLSTIATEIGIHRTTLAAGFRRWCGSSVGEEIRRVRIREAIHLLRTTHRPIGAIAVDAGFHDQPHLTRTLQQEIGRTPLQIRRSSEP